MYTQEMIDLSQKNKQLDDIGANSEIKSDRSFEKCILTVDV